MFTDLEFVAKTQLANKMAGAGAGYAGSSSALQDCGSGSTSGTSSKIPLEQNQGH